MAKLKTRKSVLKRIKITKTGKIVRRKAGQNHYRSKMTGKQRRASRRPLLLSPADTKKMKKLLNISTL